MIITCNNCLKKFDVNSSLIPQKGRLLQCNSCNYEWFFKNDTINNHSPAIKTQKFSETIEQPENLSVPINIENPKKLDLLNTKTIVSPEIKTIFTNINYEKKIDKDIEKNPSNDKKNFNNILGLIIVFIISFIAIIIILDTFQTPIGKIVPNFEFLLYNLYETINDIGLFLKDLI